MNRSPASIKQDRPTSLPSRQFWPDLLRIVAAFAVVFLHTVASRISQVNTGDPEWWSIVVCRALPSFAVPVFFMLSGMFLLDPAREVDTKRIMCGCGRFLAAFAFWSAFYLLALPPHQLHLGQFLKGPVHLWFLPALASCYLAAPALRAIARDRRAEEALLAVVFFLLCISTSLRALSDSFRRILPTTIAVLSMPAFLVLLGDYLHRFPLNGLRRCMLMLAGAGGLLFTIVATGLLAREGRRADFILGAGHAPVVLFSATVFTFFKSNFSCESRPERLRQIVSEVAKCTFGVYLIHQLFVKMFPIIPGPIISEVLLRSVACFALSLAAGATLRRIPMLRMFVT